MNLEHRSSPLASALTSQPSDAGVINAAADAAAAAVATDAATAGGGYGAAFSSAPFEPIREQSSQEHSVISLHSSRQSSALDFRGDMPHDLETLAEGEPCIGGVSVVER